MKIKIYVHFKDGLSASLPITVNEINNDFFTNFENSFKKDKEIVVFGNNGQITRKAKDVRSFEFVVFLALLFF